MVPAIKNLESIMKEKMSMLQGTAHSCEHVNRVVKIATFLAKREKADLELVQIGSLLHDIGRGVGEPHNETGAKLAGRILEEMNFPPEKIEKIARIVLSHPVSFKDRLETLEEKIVWDADKIDLFGVTGVVRAFHWGGTTKKPFEAVVKWCHERGKRMYDLLNTQTAKRHAKRRYENMIVFLSALEEELSVSDFE